MRGRLSLDPGACRQIWIGVLLQAVRDALLLKASRGGHSPSGPTQSEVLQAQRWFGSRDFHQVCALAGLDGQAVARKIQPLLNARRAGHDVAIPISLPRSGGASWHRGKSA